MVDIYQFTSKLKYWTTPISDKRIPGHWRHHAGAGIVCPICPSFHHLESICPNLSTWTLSAQGWKGQTRTLRRFSVCREEKIHRDIGCRFLLMQTTMWYFSLTFNQFKLHMKLVQHSQNFLSDTVFHATAFTFSGHSRGPNNR